MGQKNMLYLCLIVMGLSTGCAATIPVRASLPDTAQHTNPTKTYAFDLQPETNVPATDVFVEGLTGLEFSSEWQEEVTAVNYLFTWSGDGSPAYEYEQIVAENGRFRHGNGDDKTSQVTHLLANLTGLEPAHNVQHALLWIDDSPQWYVEVTLVDGRSVLIHSASTGFRGHAPWYIQFGEQLYWQTSGDIGFALHDLVSEKAQEYFTLEERPFAKTEIDAGPRTPLYHGADKIVGLLPLVHSLEYTFNPSTHLLQGTFILEDREDYETSSHPIMAATQMKISLPDGSIQLCVPNVAKNLTKDATLWFFDCSILSDTVLDIVPVEISFYTTTDKVLTTTGSLHLQDP